MLRRSTINANQLIGQCDVLMTTFDTLRHNTAMLAMSEGLTPNLHKLLPNGVWEERHSPASFTFPAHQAFFAGFLPTPVTGEKTERLFSAAFIGSETTGDNTCVFETPDIVSGLRSRGYRTICIGGVGFFNKQTPLGCVLPDLFCESHWSPDLGVTCRDSAANQVNLACERIAAADDDQRLFVFTNWSATHQPNCIYVEGAETDSVETQAAALADIDRHFPRVVRALRKRADVLAVLCSDHGVAYGEDGYYGHRLSHPVVMNVPYAEMVLPKLDS